MHILGAKIMTAFPRRRRTSPGASWLEFGFRATAAVSIRGASTVRYAGTIVRSWGAIDAGDRHVHVSGGLQKCGAPRVVYDSHENLQLKTNVKNSQSCAPREPRFR